MSHIQPLRFELLPPVPAISLVRRLKETPLFRFASMDELFRIASISRQVRYGAESPVQERGAPAEYIQLLVEGRVRLEGATESRGGGDLLAPPALLGFQEVLKGTPLQVSAVADTESIALVLSAEEFRTLLAANIEIAQGLFRMLLEASGDDDGAASAARSPSVRYEPREAPMRTVEKVMYLQAVPILSRATAEELYELAGIAREIPLVEKEILFPAGAPAAVVLVLAGALELSGGDGTSRRVEEGGCIGVRETLAGTSFPKGARTIASGRALQIEREPLFDLLGDRMGLLQGVFSAVLPREDGAPVGG